MREGTSLRDISGEKEKFDITIVGRLRTNPDGQWATSDESFPGIDEVLIENLLIISEKDKDDFGPILQSQNWSIFLNDCWLLGSIHALTEFHFASSITKDNLWKRATPPIPNQNLTVMARELIGIDNFGYRVRTTRLEPVAVCTEDNHATEATFAQYCNRINHFRGHKEKLFDHFEHLLPN